MKNEPSGILENPHLVHLKRPSSPHRSIDGDGLSWPSSGTKVRKEETDEEYELRLQKLASAVETILECIGENKQREGLLKTPMRYAKALLFFTKGYEESLTEILNDAVFEEDHEEMVSK